MKRVKKYKFEILTKKMNLNMKEPKIMWHLNHMSSRTLFE